MVIRPGVGATTASAVIFAVLLSSSLALYASSLNRADLLSRAEGEDSLADEAGALAAAAGASILLRTQSQLQSTVYDCSNAAAAVFAVVDGLSESESASGLLVTASAGPPGAGAVTDNMTILAPFNGSVGDDLSISLHVNESGSYAGGEVTLVKSEVHTLHLPVRLKAMAAICEGAIQGLKSAIESSVSSNCTDLDVQKLVTAGSQSSASLASAEGFGFFDGWAIIGSAPCTVGFGVSVSQLGIDGPGGAFNVRMQARGSASFWQPGSSPQV